MTIVIQPQRNLLRLSGQGFII